MAPILIVGLVVAAGAAAWAFGQKQRLAGQIGKFQKDAKAAQKSVERSELRIKELDKKLTKAKDQLNSNDSAAGERDSKLESLAEENRKLRDTLERTSGKDSAASRQVAALRAEATDLRAELDRAKAAGAQAAESVQSVRAQAEAVEKTRRDQVVEELRSATKDTKSVEVATKQYQAQVEKILARYRSMKERLIQADRDLRVVRRKAEHNQRAYKITQLQLDIAQDRLYTLEHGHAPGTRKQRVRKALGSAAAVPPPAAPSPATDEVVEEPAASQEEPPVELESADAVAPVEIPAEQPPALPVTQQTAAAPAEEATPEPAVEAPAEAEVASEPAAEEGDDEALASELEDLAAQAAARDAG